MKFGKALARIVETSVAEWMPFWIDYRLLKKKVKEVVKAEGQKGVVLRVTTADTMAKSMGEVEFFRLIDLEVRKGNAFFTNVEQQFLLRMRCIQDGLRITQELLQRRAGDLPASFTEPNREEMWTRLVRACVSVYAEILLLENYAIMSYCGFSKILKKHDRRTGFVCREKYLQQVLEKQPFAQYLRLLTMLREVDGLFRDVAAQLPDNAQRGRYEEYIEQTRQFAAAASREFVNHARHFLEPHIQVPPGAPPGAAAAAAEATAAAAVAALSGGLEGSSAASGASRQESGAPAPAAAAALLREGRPKSVAEMAVTSMLPREATAAGDSGGGTGTTRPCATSSSDEGGELRLSGSWPGGGSGGSGGSSGEKSLGGKLGKLAKARAAASGSSGSGMGPRGEAAGAARRPVAELASVPLGGARPLAGKGKRPAEDWRGSTSGRGVGVGGSEASEAGHVTPPPSPSRKRLMQSGAGAGGGTGTGGGHNGSAEGGGSGGDW